MYDKRPSLAVSVIFLSLICVKHSRAAEQPVAKIDILSIRETVAVLADKSLKPNYSIYKCDNQNCLSVDIPKHYERLEGNSKEVENIVLNIAIDSMFKATLLRMYPPDNADATMWSGMCDKIAMRCEQIVADYNVGKYTVANGTSLADIHEAQVVSMVYEMMHRYADNQNLFYEGVVYSTLVVQGFQPDQKPVPRPRNVSVASIRQIADDLAQNGVRPSYRKYNSQDVNDKNVYMEFICSTPLGRLKSEWQGIENVTVNFILDLLVVSDAIRKHPPSGVNPNQWNVMCDKVVVQCDIIARDYNSGKYSGLNGPSLALLQKQQAELLIHEALHVYADSNNLVYRNVLRYIPVAGAYVKIVTKPENAKVYIISDLMHRVLTKRGIDPKKEIKKYEAGPSVYGLVGKVWYLAVWKDGDSGELKQRTVDRDEFIIAK